MGIAGNLRTMAAADLLQWLAQGRRTGTLLVSNGTVEKSIFFRVGVIISSASTDPREYLGHFLVSHGFIDERQLADAVAQQETSRTLLGKILVDQHAISAEDLDQMLRMKAEEGIYDLFSWGEGEFEFLDGKLPEYEMVAISIGVEGLLLEGMQRMDEWTKMREIVPSAQAVPVAVRGLLEDTELSDRDRAVLEQVNDDRSIEEICLHTHSSEYLVCRVIYRQALDGNIKVVRPRVVETRTVAETTSAASLVAAAQAHVDRGELEPAYRNICAARSLEPTNHALLGAVKRATELIFEHLAVDGVDGSCVPQLLTGLKEVAGLDLTPQEGFIISRINGSSDVATIVKISPLPELEARLVFWKLLRAGIIRLESPAGIEGHQ